MKPSQDPGASHAATTSCHAAHALPFDARRRDDLQSMRGSHRRPTIDNRKSIQCKVHSPLSALGDPSKPIPTCPRPRSTRSRPPAVDADRSAASAAAAATVPVDAVWVVRLALRPATRADLQVLLQPSSLASDGMMVSTLSQRPWRSLTPLRVVVLVGALPASTSCMHSKPLV